MAFGIGDNLEVTITGDSDSLERAVDSAERSLTGLVDNSATAAGALQALQGRADEAGDEMADVGRESSQASRRLTGVAAAAGGTAASFSALTAVTTPLTFSMNGLANTPLIFLFPALTAGATALLATLFPLAAVIGTLTAGAAALAGAFGLVVGTGLVAFNEEVQPLTEALADLRDEILPIIVEFGERFIPLIADAIDAIPELVENTLDAVGGMGEFIAVLRDLGQMAFDLIPELVAGMVDFARIALPPFMDFIEFMRGNASDAFAGMVRVTRELAPELRAFGRAFLNALPEITALGTAVLNVLLPAFSSFFRLIEDVVNLAQSEGGLVSFLQAAVRNAVSWVQGPGMNLLESVGTTLLDTLAAVLDPDGTGEGGFYSALVDRISSVLQRLSMWMQSGGQQEITNTITALFAGLNTAIEGEEETLVNQILTPLTNILAGTFRALFQALASDEAGVLSAEIGRFANQLGQLVTQGLAEYFTSDQFASDLALIAKAIANTIGTAIVSYIRENPEVALTGGMSLLWEEQADMFVDQFSPTETVPGAVDTQERGGGVTEVTVNVEGDTDVVRNVTAEAIESETRRARRQGNRGQLQR